MVQGWSGENMGPLGEMDGLLVPPGKAAKLLTDHLITGQPLKSEPAQEMWFSQTFHTYMPYWLSWVVIFMKHILSHDILMLDKSPICFMFWSRIFVLFQPYVQVRVIEWPPFGK